MARAILGRTSGFHRIICLIGIGLTFACANKPETNSACIVDFSNIPEHLQQDAKTFQEHVLAGPFYKLIRGRLGEATDCDLRMHAGGPKLTYHFIDNGNLDARTNPTIEFSEQRLTMSGLSKNEAADLLRRAERDAFGNQGCGIDWNTLSESVKHQNGHDIIYRGDVCNCQARVIYHNGQIVSLLFRSTC